MRWILLGLCLLGLSSACVTSRNSPLQAYRSQLIESVPFVPQDPEACGPATLAMSMAWAGERSMQPKALADELGQFLITPEKNGSLQSDMLSAARRWGYMAFPLQSWEQLMQELSAQHPVIVLQNLRQEWWPQWHYAVAIGYDTEREQLILHSGRTARLAMAWDSFDRSWALAGRWGLLLLPAGVRAPSQGEREHVLAAAALERLGMNERARLAYQSILAQWPDSLGGRVGLANVAFAMGHVDSAIEHLEQAVKHHPETPGAWHNLAQAYAQKQDFAKAEAAARQALAHADAADRPFFASKLEPILREKPVH